MPFIKLFSVVSAGALCAVIGGCSPSVTAPSTSSSTTTTQTAPFTLNGQVLRAGTSTGVPSATVTLTAAAASPLTTTTDANGAFSFSGLTTSGTYTLQVVAAGYVPATTTLSIPVASFAVNLAPATPPQPVPVLTVTGTATLGAVGQTSQLTATVTLPDGTTSDVTFIAKWSSSNPAVAHVSSSGLVTAFTRGVTTISASLTNESGALDVAVTF